MFDNAEFRNVVARIQSRVQGVSAVAILGPGGGVEAVFQADPGFDPEKLAEFATLLRIAERVSADTASGRLGSMSWKTENAVVLIDRVSPERSILLVGSPELHVGLARYHLSRAARRLAASQSLSASV